MRNRQMLFRCALLGSALGLATMTAASAANSADQKRILAVEGIHSSAFRAGSGADFSATRLHSTYTDLHDFAGPPNDGAGSGAGVTLDKSGNIYGTTDDGGANSSGAFFKLAPNGTATLLHSFGGTGDGSFPDGAVSIVKGDFFGTTEDGGSSGNGTIWELAADGTYSILHNFDGTNDGSFVRGHLVRDSQGNFYGTALFGGANSDGTVFKYASDGTLTVLHAFNGTDGEFPEHGVVRDKAGNLYGVTAFGGAGGEGTVYEIAADGTFTSLYSFTGGTDGGFLYGGLALDKSGNLYGSTASGGASTFGTAFKLTSAGTLTTLYNFTNSTDGGAPEGDMLRVGKNLYSTASSGGDPTCQCGVVYEIKASGKEKVLHTFVNSTGGGYSDGLTKGKKLFYGTTQSYGANNFGVVFSVK